MGLSLLFILSTCALIAFGRNVSAQTAAEQMFIVRDGTVEEGEVTAEGEARQSLRFSSSDSCYEAAYRHTVYIDDNSADTDLCTVFYDSAELVRLEIVVEDAVYAGEGFRIVAGNRYAEDGGPDGIYAAAGKLGEALAGYSADGDVTDAENQADGTPVTEEKSGLISFFYDADTHEICAASGGQRVTVRKLNGLSALEDTVSFAGFPGGECRITLRAWRAAEIGGKAYEAENASAAFHLLSLDGQDVIAQEYAQTYVLRPVSGAFQGYEYRLPMPQKFDLPHGKQDAEGFTCVVKKMTQKLFDGEVERGSSFLAEVGTYKIEYLYPDGSAFESYSVTTYTQGLYETQLVLSEEPQTEYAVGQEWKIPAAYTQNKGYLDGYTDAVTATVLRGGEAVSQPLPADGTQTFAAEEEGEYVLLFEAQDLFGRSYSKECAVTVSGGAYVVTEGELPRYMAAGGTLYLPEAELFSSSSALQRRLIAPDGSEVLCDNAETGEFVRLTEKGVYTLEYSAGEEKLEEHFVLVSEKLSALFTATQDCSICRDTVSVSLKDGTQYRGVGILSQGEAPAAEYSGILYIADNTAQDSLLEIMPLFSEQTSATESIIIRLTDAEDAQSYVEIVIRQSSLGDYAAVTAGAAGQDLYGINRGVLTEEGTQLPFGLASETVVSGNTTYTGSYAPVSIGYDAETASVYVSPSRFGDAPQALVRDLRDPGASNEQELPVSGQSFAGFPSGAVKVSIRLEGAKEDSACAAVITSLDGQTLAARFDRVEEYKAPVALVSSDNVLLGSDYIFPQPRIFSVLDPDVRYTGEKVVTFRGKEVYRGKETSFLPQEAGIYTVTYTGLCDSFKTAGQDFSCTFSVFENLDTSIDFSDKTFLSEQPWAWLVPEGVLVGARGFSNLSEDGSVPLRLTVYQGTQEIASFDVEEDTRFDFPDSGSYRLEYEGRDPGGNIVSETVLLQVDRVLLGLEEGLNEEEKWVLFEKRPPFTVGKEDLTVFDTLAGDKKAVADVSISVRLNGEELSDGVSYAFGNDSALGMYEIVYTVSYEEGGRTYSAQLFRRIEISEDDVPPVITAEGGTERVYFAQSGALEISASDVTVWDNKDVEISLSGIALSEGDRTGDTGTEGWTALSAEGQDISGLLRHAGFYTVRFTAVDEAGNAGYAYILIDAVDTEPPVIAFTEDKEQVQGAVLLEKLSEKSLRFKALTGSEILLPEAVVSDVGFSEVSLQIGIRKILQDSEEVIASDVSGKFIPAQPGTDVVSYYAEDTAGFTDKVVLVFDVRDRWITATLQGENPSTQKTGGVIELKGVDVTDYGGDAVLDCTVTVTVKNGSETVYSGSELCFRPQGIGTYTITYSIASGAETVYIENLMTVLDGIPPQILGEDLPSSFRGGDKISVGYFTATDDVDGELGVTVIVTADGRTVEVRDGQFVAESGKEYVVTVLAADYTGNTSVREFVLKEQNVLLIAGIVVGAILAAAAVSVAVFLFMRRRKKNANR